MNEWALDKWATADDEGLFVSLIVANQTPAAAAAEIRRLGRNVRVAQLLMTGNGIGKPFGHPLYHPIYEAAVELDLPVAIHVGGDATADTLTVPAAGSPPSTFSEYRALSAQALMTHAVSMIGQGLFETYPGLRVFLIGGGIDWVPSTLWRADLEFRAWASSAPWVKRKPSEYMFEHFWFGTYQMDLAPAATIEKVIAAYPQLGDRIVYASGYPAIDSLTPEHARELVRGVPPEKLFRDNALALFGDRLRSPLAV
jgi:predicted TIM-barrel fold metal-dependent hydrolase